MRTIESQAYRAASAGVVDTAAAATAAGAIDIEAPIHAVWDALADPRNWPGIRSDVSDVESSGPAEAGAWFTWHAGGIPVSSAFALVERPTRLTWATTAPGLSMVGVYEFDELDSARTRIRCQESMDVTAEGHHIDNEVLTELIRTWLAGISAYVEHREHKRTDKQMNESRSV